MYCRMVGYTLTFDCNRMLRGLRVDRRMGIGIKLDATAAQAGSIV